MMSAPYSLLGAASIVAPFCKPARSANQSSIWRSHRRGYSSSGIANRSIRSGLPDLMNHGTYSAKCSEDSVTK